MKKRALISVYDKTNIVAFATQLIELGWEIVSTGGTYTLLKENHLPVIEVNEVTNVKEMLDGRVKTLHPLIHGGILYRRDNKNHVETIKNEKIHGIDMVVNNLYPFEKVLNSNNPTHELLIENIDIGGPSMIRAAAKNYQDVLIVTDVEDYGLVLDHLTNHNPKLNRYLAGKAFNYTAYYDALIAAYFNDYLDISFPERLTLTYQKTSKLRYGENPHQDAAQYKSVYIPKNEKCEFKQLHGKELSYNNLTDSYAAIKMVKLFKEPCVVGIKHANPSGIAIGNTIEEAYDKAYACDEISIFGGIIALNRPVSVYVAEKIHSFFAEIVIAPSFDKEAFEILTQKKNIRLIQMENITTFELPTKTSKPIVNGIVYQDEDNVIFKDELKVVTKAQPTPKQMEDLIFAFTACKGVSSNGVVIAKDLATIGIGQGEVRRSWAVEKALDRMQTHFKTVENAVMASDAFFFEDTVQLLHENGITAVIQPGGSIKDEAVIRLCDELGIAMVFTGIRHFRH